MNRFLSNFLRQKTFVDFNSFTYSLPIWDPLILYQLIADRNMNLLSSVLTATLALREYILCSVLQTFYITTSIPIKVKVFLVVAVSTSILILHQPCMYVGCSQFAWFEL